MIKREWQQPFEVANSWAHKQLGQRLEQDAFGHVEALIATLLKPTSGTEGQGPTRIQATDSVTRHGSSQSQAMNSITHTSPRPTQGPNGNNNGVSEEDFPPLCSSNTAPATITPPLPRLSPREQRPQRSCRNANLCVMEENETAVTVSQETPAPTAQAPALQESAVAPIPERLVLIQDAHQNTAIEQSMPTDPNPITSPTQT